LVRLVRGEIGERKKGRREKGQGLRGKEGGVLPLAPCFWGAYSWAVKMRAIKSQQRGECLTKVLTSSFEVRGEGVRADLAGVSLGARRLSGQKAILV
jgi:hypothetical protein